MNASVTSDLVKVAEGIGAWLLHRFGPNTPEALEAQTLLAAANSAHETTARRDCDGCGLPATAACPHCDTPTCGKCANCEHAPEETSGGEAALRRVIDRHVRWRETAIGFLRQVIDGRGSEDEWPALADFLERSDSRMVESSSVEPTALCPGCEGSPKEGNNPCAVCGRERCGMPHELYWRTCDLPKGHKDNHRSETKGSVCWWASDLTAEQQREILAKRAPVNGTPPP